MSPDPARPAVSHRKLQLIAAVMHSLFNLVQPL